MNFGFHHTYYIFLGESVILMISSRRRMQSRLFLNCLAVATNLYEKAKNSPKRHTFQICYFVNKYMYTHIR